MGLDLSGAVTPVGVYGPSNLGSLVALEGARVVSRDVAGSLRAESPERRPATAPPPGGGVQTESLVDAIRKFSVRP